MNVDDAIKRIKAETEDILSRTLEHAATKSGGRRGFVCPICGHGEHDEGLVFVPHSKTGGAEQLHCFACDFGGDIIDLRQQQLGTGFRPALESLAFDAGIQLDWTPEAEKRPQRGQKRPLTHYRPLGGITYPLQGENPAESKLGGKNGTSQNPPVEEEQAAAPEAEADYMEYYAACGARIDDPRAVEYLEGRGLSIDLCRRYRLGYDPEADPAKTGHKSARIIIPTTRSHYIARAIDPATPKAYKALNPVGSHPGIFNAAVLTCGGVIFVAEGWADALAIIQSGGTAVAINSTSNTSILLQALQGIQTQPQCIILALDTDAAGQTAAAKLREGLEALQIPTYTADLCGDYKDPADRLEDDPEGLQQDVLTAIHRAHRPEGVSAYLVDSYLTSLRVTGTPVMTGFSQIDTAGGIYPGLYILGATSSLGKTTWALQLADQIAGNKGGHRDVLYFGTEQGRRELVSKSIARTAAQRDPRTMLTALRIQTDPSCRGEEFIAALNAYRTDVLDFLSIIEGGFGLTPAAIRARIDDHRRRTSATPVVIIDYLQVLRSGADKRPDRRAEIDDILTQIKIISQDYATPVLLISSLNRAGYSKPVDFEAFKESGGIEYTADVVWGMQLAAVTAAGDTALSPAALREAKGVIPRGVDIVCLKNRFGRTGTSYKYDYDPVRDLFTECN